MLKKEFQSYVLGHKKCLSNDVWPNSKDVFEKFLRKVYDSMDFLYKFFNEFQTQIHPHIFNSLLLKFPNVNNSAKK